LLLGDRVLAARAEPMARGQAERLMPLLEEVLAEAGHVWGDLARIGVGVGPGNFTGIRIGVSAARGLALALDIPAIGVSGFEIIAEAEGSDAIPAIPAPQGQAYTWRDGAPAFVAAEDLPGAAGLPEPQEMARHIARVVTRTEAAPAPVPLYVKPADAAPPRDAPPEIVDDLG
jgi:tRNA A37 threonylcarbamoyladenosine modification protein TsaB